MSSEPKTLPEVESSVWRELSSAIVDGSQWRFPVLATIQNGEPRARTIVLRAADRASRILLFHTDARSPKVRQLESNSRVSLVFYDHDRLVQLAITGEASLHFDDFVADEQWSATPVSSRRAYLAPLVPGTIAEQPEANLPPNFVGRLPDEAELQPARPNFAVIAVSVGSIDWLRLSRSSNLRARFAYEGDNISMQWIAP